jgi:autotransporter-associated beta strand protein
MKIQDYQTHFRVIATVLALAGPVSAVTFTRVDLPDPMTEADAGVNMATSTYTHAFNFGNGSSTDVDINGLLFDTKNLAATLTDNNRSGNTITAAVTAGTLGNNAGNSSVKAAAGDMKTVMQPFGFNSSGALGTFSFTINNLTAGVPYIARFYGYQWDTLATTRTVQMSSDVDADTANIEWGNGTRYRCFYVEVAYTPTTSSAKINFKAVTSGNGPHITAITNHTLTVVPPPVKWSGTASALWNAADVNFTGQSFGAFKTANGNKVIFADTDGASLPVANTSITVDPAGVSIADVAFENTTAVGYTINASGGLGITSSTKVSKTGNGSVSLLGSHSYTGNTSVDAGTLTLDTAYLADASTVSVATGAVLNLTHSDTDFVKGLSLGGVAQPDGIYSSSTPGGFITGSGKIVVSSDNSILWTGAVDNSWNVTGNWDVPLVPNNSALTADFSFDAPAGLTTINLDDNKSIGTIKFDDTGFTPDGDLKIAAGTPGTSALSMTGGTGTINVVDADRTLTVETGNTLAGFATKSGPGTLIIKDPTSTRIGAGSVFGGTLRLLNTTGASTLCTLDFTMNGGSTLEIDASVGGSWSGGTLLVGQTGTATLRHKNGILSYPLTSDMVVGNSTNGNGTIVMEGGTFSIAKGTGSKEWIMMGRDPQATGVQTGRVFLEGGTLQTSRTLVGSGSNTSTDYLAEVYLDGGTLKAETGVPVNVTYGWLQASANGNALALSNVFVRDGGAKFDTNGQDILIAAALVEDGTQPGGGLTKSGLGALTLSGLSTYTGNTTVTDGSLVITTDDVLADTSTVTIPSSGSLSLSHSGTDIVAALVINGVSQPNGTYAFGTGSLQVGTSTPFQTWALGKGLTGASGFENGPADDPDKDGSTNLAEFAFNGNPLSGSDNGQVYVLTADSDGDVDTTKELVLTVAVRKTTPAFTAGAPATAPMTDGVTYSIEGSTDLSTFGVTVTPVGFVDPGVALTDSTNYEYRSFSLSGSNELAGKGFLRAKAQD